VEEVKVFVVVSRRDRRWTSDSEKFVLVAEMGNRRSDRGKNSRKLDAGRRFHVTSL
jgi:hypothetical protein